MCACLSYVYVYCRLELHLVGGFEDDLGNSEEVSLDLFGEWMAVAAPFIYTFPSLK